MFRKEMSKLKPYIPGKSIEEVMKAYQVVDIVKLASNENPLGPSELAIKSIQERAPYVHLYPDGSALELRNKLAYKYSVDPNQILIGSGGEQIIKLVAQTFIDGGDEVIFANPSFTMYEIMSTHIGAKCLSLDLTDDFKHDFDGFKKAITDRTKLIYICNPNNPTGNIMTNHELNSFLKDIPEHIIVMLDEAYYEYACHDATYPNGIEILKTRPNTIVLRTFSKISGLAGMRIAYCFSSAEITQEMNKIRGVFNANKLAQHAAVASMDDEDHLDKTLKLNKASMKRMMDYFDEKDLDYVESHTNFIFVNVKKNSKEVYEALMKKGVIVRPGFLWGYDDYLRVSTGTVEQTNKFIQALDETLYL
ncbi:histidinol-phosphate transaminase [Acidaminobacter sp. JC074]|uniref:histidinol-phosphate transaminase n=1 Tax=Acidaminobacter sp. JC074 TaxID=2530199 RepID=UPI001F0D0C7A|nr:histidinol-phosphate transaminase [Acidaminobacter sp. JC074]MCH4886065.1 histidinol-phosphate transaminase [Acidaminobacter sp. JC074]